MYNIKKTGRDGGDNPWMESRQVGFCLLTFCTLWTREPSDCLALRQLGRFQHHQVINLSSWSEYSAKPSNKMSYGSKQYWAMCIFLFVFLDGIYICTSPRNIWSWGRVFHEGTGAMFSPEKKKQKNNNSSRGFHLLSAGSDENTSQHTNRPGLAIGVGDF